MYTLVLSMISPTDVSLPNVTSALLLVRVNLISKVSDPSTSSSQVTDILALPSVAPGLIVIVNGSELKSVPDPIRTHVYMIKQYLLFISCGNGVSLIYGIKYELEWNDGLERRYLFTHVSFIHYITA